LGGLLNFYLGVWSLSKVAIGRINKLVRRFIWNKDSGKGIEVGWQWCSLPREKGGLGIPNILAKGVVLGSKWTTKVISSNEIWASCHRGYVESAEFKYFKGWAKVSLEEKMLVEWELDMKGPIFFKRMWTAWRAIRGVLDI